MQKTFPGFANNIGADQPAHCLCYLFIAKYSKTCVKRPLSERQKIGFQDQLSLNAVQKYCRILQREHSAILSTFIKLKDVIKTFLSGRFTQILLYHISKLATVSRFLLVS